MIVFILTILDVEFEAVKKHLTAIKECETKQEGIVYLKGLFKGNSGKRHTIYLYRANEMANIHAGLMTYIGLKQNTVDLGLLVGVCGGIKDLHLGDVIVGRKIYGYEIGKIIKDDHLARPEVGNLATNISSRCVMECSTNKWQELIIRENNTSNPKAIVGTIAAGEKVITSNKSQIYKFIKSKYNDTQAVEMEGIGFVKGAHTIGFNQIAVIRGVSDQLNNKNSADSQGYQEISSANAAAFAFNLIDTLKVQKPRVSKKKKSKTKLLPTLWTVKIKGEFEEHTKQSVTILLNDTFKKIQKLAGTKIESSNFEVKNMRKGSIIVDVAVDRVINNALMTIINNRHILPEELNQNIISIQKSINSKNSISKKIGDDTSNIIESKNPLIVGILTSISSQALLLINATISERYFVGEFRENTKTLFLYNRSDVRSKFLLKKYTKPSTGKETTLLFGITQKQSRKLVLNLLPERNSEIPHFIISFYGDDKFIKAIASGLYQIILVMRRFDVMKPYKSKYRFRDNVSSGSKVIKRTTTAKAVAMKKAKKAR